ncbi:hypothetical protein JCM17960_12390 [Magnetospira thiophila]
MTRQIDHPTPTAPEIGLFDLAALGLGSIAYVRPVQMQDEMVYGIFSADGTQIGMASGAEEAFIAARHNDLQPHLVH